MHKKKKGVGDSAQAKAVFVGEECHRMVRTIAALNGVSMGRWAEAALIKAYNKEIRSVS